MNLHDPKPSDPSHPRPDPATPVNSSWRQPPPRAPSLTEMVRKWLDQPLTNHHESPWTPQWTLDELQARFAKIKEYSGGGICRLYDDRSNNERSNDERSTIDGSEDADESDDFTSYDDGLQDVGAPNDGDPSEGPVDDDERSIDTQ